MSISTAHNALQTARALSDEEIAERLARPAGRSDGIEFDDVRSRHKTRVRRLILHLVLEDRRNEDADPGVLMYQKPQTDLAYLLAAHGHENERGRPPGRPEGANSMDIYRHSCDLFDLSQAALDHMLEASGGESDRDFTEAEHDAWTLLLDVHDKLRDLKVKASAIDLEQIDAALADCRRMREERAARAR